MPSFKLGELFSGPGGMALGAKLAAEEFQKEHGGVLPIEHVWGVDLDVNARNTYHANLPGEGVCIDANDFVNNTSEDHKTISSFDKISALAFGFPCNDFSLVGEQKGMQGKFGNLYRAGVAAIQKTDPLFFVAENVSGIHSANSDAAFYKIIKELESAGMGYKITTHLFKFEEYGVPQARHRYIIVGFRSDLGLEFKVPSPKPYADLDNTCKYALSKVDNGLEGGVFTKQSDQVIWRLIFTPPGVNAWKLDEIVEWRDDKLLEYLQTIPWFHEKIKPLGSVNKMRDKIEYCRLHVNTGSKMSHIYKRLIANRPAYTITGSGGGGTHVYHWEEPRALTNRERAALQTFPSDFVFKGSKEQIRKQIGMAVPPQGAKIIFRAILDTFSGYRYESLEEPSYKLMQDSEFKKYRTKRYVLRLKTLLKKSFHFDPNEFILLSDFISECIEKDKPIDIAMEEIFRMSLLELTKIKSEES